MSDDWSRLSRASSALGGYKYRAESNTPSKAPSNNSLMEAKAIRDSFRGNGSNDSGSMLHRSDRPGKSDLVDALVRANASDAESDIYVIGSRPVSQNQDRTTTIPGFTPRKSYTNGQPDIPVVLPTPGVSERASPTRNPASLKPDSPYAYKPRDSNAPKEPLSAYLRYAKQMLPFIQQEMNEHPDRFISAWGEPIYANDVVTDRWLAMTQEQKAPYRAAYQADLKNYEVAMAAYKAVGGVNDGLPAVSGYPAHEKMQPGLPAQDNFDFYVGDSKHPSSNFRRATVETESGPDRSPSASVKEFDGGWDAAKRSDRGWDSGDCSGADGQGLYENGSCNSPVQEPKKTRDNGGWGRNFWGSPPPRRDGWGAASVSLDSNDRGWCSESKWGDSLKPTPKTATEGRQYCTWCGGLVGCCDCDEIARREEENRKMGNTRRGWGDDDDLVSLPSKRNPNFKLESECTEDDGGCANSVSRPGNSIIGNAVPPEQAYSYANVYAGAGGAYNASYNAMNLPAQQPVGVHPTTIANYQATVANYEAYIIELQSQVQTRDRELNSQGKLLAKTESHISTGQNIGLRKEAEFLRQRLASGNLSTEDRAKAIDIINLIEGKPSEEPLTTHVSKDGVAKATTFNVSSHGHENGSVNFALDLKMHDLTKSITKMKAFDKFQRLQQDSDRLARIEDKLAKSQDKPKDKTKESDRVTAFQKRTAREVERLNRRLDELLSSKTETVSKGKVSQEIQNIHSLIDNLNERFADNEGLMYSVSEDIQEMRNTFTKNEKASNTANNENTSPRNANPTFQAPSHDSWGQPLGKGDSRGGWAPRSRTMDYSSYDDGRQPVNSPRPSDGCQCPGDICDYCGWHWKKCRCFGIRSDFGSEIETPGRVGTVASSVNEDCGPIQTFNLRNLPKATKKVETTSSKKSASAGDSKVYRGGDIFAGAGGATVNISPRDAVHASGWDESKFELADAKVLDSSSPPLKWDDNNQWF